MTENTLPSLDKKGIISFPFFHLDVYLFSLFSEEKAI